MNKLLLQENLPSISLQHYREIFTFPVIDYYKRAGHTFQKNSFEVLGKQFMVDYEKNKFNCSLFPMAKDLLDTFKKLGIKQHLLSAYRQESLERIIAEFKIDNYFDNVVGLDNIYASGKMELGKKLIKKIGSNGRQDNVLLIGDTLHDYEVAKNINADCILVASGHQDKTKLLTADAFIVDDLKELHKIFNAEDLR